MWSLSISVGILLLGIASLTAEDADVSEEGVTLRLDLCFDEQILHSDFFIRLPYLSLHIICRSILIVTSSVFIGLVESQYLRTPSGVRQCCIIKERNMSVLA